MKNVINKILCAIDGSRSAEKAIDYAVHLAKATEASLTFVTVNTVSDQDTAKEPRQWDSIETSAIDIQVDTILRAAEARAKQAGGDEHNINYVVLHGHDIPATLVDYTQQSGYDLIVMGSEGMSGIKRLLLGSCAQDVVSKAHCPVTIVR